MKIGGSKSRYLKDSESGLKNRCATCHYFEVTDIDVLISVLFLRRPFWVPPYALGNKAVKMSISSKIAP